MGNSLLFFTGPEGGSSGIFSMDPLMPLSFRDHWLSHIALLIDNSRYLCVHGSTAIQEAFNCMSAFSGALALWFASGLNPNINCKIQGDYIGSSSSYSKTYAQTKRISSVSRDLPGFFWKARSKRKTSTFGKISGLTLKQLCGEAEWVQSFPVFSLAAALVPPFTNVSSKVLAIPLETGSANTQLCMELDQRPCEIENRGCGPFNDLCFQNLAWSKNAVEPRTGIEFPSMLDSAVDGESDSGFSPEVLVGTGSRTMTIIRIKSLKVYAFGFYVHPFDVCEKLGPKYACIPEHELNKRQEFYQDLLREDINMTIRLVVSCNGIKINTVKDAFEKSLRARLTKTNPDTDFRCLETFGSLFSQDIPLHMGTIINFRRTADGHLITEVGGNHIGAVQSKDLCRAFFDMYIGDIPVCEQTKEEIGKNVASIIGLC